MKDKNGNKIEVGMNVDFSGQPGSVVESSTILVIFRMGFKVSFCVMLSKNNSINLVEIIDLSGDWKYDC